MKLQLEIVINIPHMVYGIKDFFYFIKRGLLYKASTRIFSFDYPISDNTPGLYLNILGIDFYFKIQRKDNVHNRMDNNSY